MQQGRCVLGQEALTSDWLVGAMAQFLKACSDFGVGVVAGKIV